MDLKADDLRKAFRLRRTGLDGTELDGTDLTCHYRIGQDTFFSWPWPFRYDALENGLAITTVHSTKRG